MTATNGSTNASGTVTISITDAEEAANAIFLSNSLVVENEPIGTVVAQISVEDDDEGDSHTIAISGSNAGSFEIVGTELRTSQEIDYEENQTLAITLTAVDNSSRSYSQDFVIDVENLSPEAPTDITLSNNVIEIGQPSGTTIGVFEVEDDDAGDSHTLALLNGSGVQVEGSELKSSSEFSSPETIEIEVLATDNDGFSITRTFIIEVIETALGIDDLDQSLVSIYPNPATGYFNIVLDQTLSNVTWRLTDVSGKIIIKESSANQVSEILVDVSSLKSGIYFVKINAEEGQVTKRLLISGQ